MGFESSQRKLQVRAPHSWRIHHGYGPGAAATIKIVRESGFLKKRNYLLTFSEDL
jgi:hypothetical protein